MSEYVKRDCRQCAKFCQPTCPSDHETMAVMRDRGLLTATPMHTMHEGKIGKCSAYQPAEEKKG